MINAFKPIYNYERSQKLEVFSKMSHDILLDKETSGDMTVYQGWKESTAGVAFHQLVVSLGAEKHISNLLEIYIEELTNFTVSDSLESELYLLSVLEYIKDNKIDSVLTISNFDDIFEGKFPDGDILKTAIEEFKIYKAKFGERFHSVILAAANKFRIEKDSVFIKDITLVDSCHLGRNMLSTIKAFQDAGFDVFPCHELEDCGEGFVDGDGIYYNRSEAFEIVRQSGQLFNSEYTLPKNKLDSSCIRHFMIDVPLSCYLPKM